MFRRQFHEGEPAPGSDDRNLYVLPQDDFTQIAEVAQFDADTETMRQQIGYIATEGSDMAALERTVKHELQRNRDLKTCANHYNTLQTLLTLRYALCHPGEPDNIVNDPAPYRDTHVREYREPSWRYGWGGYEQHPVDIARWERERIFDNNLSIRQLYEKADETLWADENILKVQLQHMHAVSVNYGTENSGGLQRVPVWVIGSEPQPDGSVEFIGATPDKMLPETAQFYNRNHAGWGCNVPASGRAPFADMATNMHDNFRRGQPDSFTELGEQLLRQDKSIFALFHFTAEAPLPGGKSAILPAPEITARDLLELSRPVQGSRNREFCIEPARLAEKFPIEEMPIVSEMRYATLDDYTMSRYSVAQHLQELAIAYGIGHTLPRIAAHTQIYRNKADIG